MCPDCLCNGILWVKVRILVEEYMPLLETILVLSLCYCHEGPYLTINFGSPSRSTWTYWGTGVSGHQFKCLLIETESPLVKVQGPCWDNLSLLDPGSELLEHHPSSFPTSHFSCVPSWCPRKYSKQQCDPSLSFQGSFWP